MPQPFPLFYPFNRPMRVAGFLSGVGSTIRKIIEYERNLKQKHRASAYDVVVLFSDSVGSHAGAMGKEFGIPVCISDLVDFCRTRGKSKRDLETRVAFDQETARMLSLFAIDVVAYAGYMSIATEPLLNAYLGINVHPADLSVVEGGRRKYRGRHAVREAILAGETFLRSSTHLVAPQVDDGKILIISAPLEVSLPETFDPRDTAQVKSIAAVHQERLKVVGDWVIFPQTLEYLATGRFGKDESGDLYFDGVQIPFGLRADYLPPFNACV